MGDKLTGAIAALLITASCGFVVMAFVFAWAHSVKGVASSLALAAPLMISGLKLWSTPNDHP
jgi:hypothetical protein